MQTSTPAAQSLWKSFQLFYHGDRDLLLMRFVAPLVASLTVAGKLVSFFFIRHELGGPHIRLRLRCDGYEPDLEPLVCDAAADFLARFPSPKLVPEDVIRRNNRKILSWDRHEHDDTIRPDGTVESVPFRPEIERYGGQDLIDHSLEFFALSSIKTLDFLAAHQQEPRSHRFPRILRLLFQQSWGSSGDELDLRRLLGFAIEAWGDSLKKSLDQADRTFESRRFELDALIQEEIEKRLMGEDPPALTRAAARLSRRLAATDAATRELVMQSQLHMTANRLGLTNAEEVYIGRLLSRAFEDLLEIEDDLARRTRTALAEQILVGDGSEDEEKDQIASALTAFAAQTELSAP